MDGKVKVSARKNTQKVLKFFRVMKNRSIEILVSNEKWLKFLKGGF